MDSLRHEAALAGLRRQLRMSLALALLLAVGVCLLAAAVAVLGSGGGRVVVVPPEVRSQFWVEPDRVSREYFLEWGYYVATLLLNVTPASVDYQNEVLLRHVAPAHRETQRHELAAAARRLKREQLSTFFSVADIHVSPASGEVRFVGTLSSYVQGRRIDERQAAFAATFTVAGGRLLLAAFDEIDPAAAAQGLQS